MQPRIIMSVGIMVILISFAVYIYIGMQQAKKNMDFEDDTFESESQSGEPFDLLSALEEDEGVMSEEARQSMVERLNQAQ
ncbi:MAG: hypothetical protein ACK42D_02395 [Candidatus Paceibacteria bacterium]